MKRKTIITGLDIGSSKIASVSAEIGDDGSFDVIAQVTGSSTGVYRGIPTDLCGAVDSVSKVLSKLAQKSGVRPRDIYVNISGRSIKGTKSRGMIPLAIRGREVIRPDVERCVNVASTINLPFDREIIHKIVSGFSVDDNSWIKNPIGLFASRLNGEVYIVTADVNHIQNIYKCVNQSGYDVKEVVYTGIANAACLLDYAQKESGSVIADMGSSLTEISVFYGGALCDLEVIPLGSDDFGENWKDDAGLMRVTENISCKLRKATETLGKPASVVITGGFAFKDGVIECLEQRLQCSVNMGIVRELRGDISSIEAIRSAGAIGLCKYGRDKLIQKSSIEGGPMRRLSTKVADIFNNYF